MNDVEFSHSLVSCWTEGLGFALRKERVMSHREQLEFIQQVKQYFPEMFIGKRILEVGSLDINGSIRQFFEDCDYIGLDVAPGNGVDVICEGQSYDAPEASFDVVISCEAMEHNPYWKETLANMIRLVKPSGLVVMSCATYGRPEHGTEASDPGSSPLTVGKGWNYYKNISARELVQSGCLKGIGIWKSASNWDTYDLYFVGVKSSVHPEQADALRSLFSPYRKRFWRSLKWMRRAVRKHLKQRLFGIS